LSEENECLCYGEVGSVNERYLRFWTGWNSESWSATEVLRIEIGDGGW